MSNKINVEGSHEDTESEFSSNENEEYDTQEEYVENVSNNMFRVPLFDGQSVMTARTRLPAKRFDIWAEVSAVCGRGTLVSTSGARDHLWLGFVDDKVVLNWNAGSGASVLRTGKLKHYGKMKITAKRYKKDAMLKLGSAVATGTAHGHMSSLDVDPFIYVGQPPANVTSILGAAALPGFVGCIHHLRVSGRDIIPPARGLSITSHGLRPCTPYNLARLVCP